MDFLAFSADHAAPSVISETASAPWMRCAQMPPSATPKFPLIDLHNEIVTLSEYVSPTIQDDKIRSDLVSEMSGIILAVFPSSRVQVFGSQLTRILTPNSDLDIAVLDTNENGAEALYKLEKAILDKGIASYLEVIANAKVPIIKLDHIASGISVDILCSNEYGMAAFETGKLLKRLVGDYPALRPLTILLKVFLAQRKLNETYGGGIGSFVLSNMVISFLQMRQRLFVAEGKREDAVSNNLGALLIEFLNLYGNTFNYRDVGISILDGGKYFDKSAKEGNWMNPSRPILLAIENPESPGTDMGRNSFLIPRIKKSFEHAHRVLLYSLTCGKAVSSMLSLILNADDPALVSIVVPSRINKALCDSKSPEVEDDVERDNEIKKKRKSKKDKKRKKDRDYDLEAAPLSDEGVNVENTTDIGVKKISSGRKVAIYHEPHADLSDTTPLKKRGKR